MTENNLSKKIEEAIDMGLKYAKKEGASHCEGYGTLQNLFNLEVEKDKPKHSLGIQHGLSFRVIANQSYGFAYTSAFDETSIKQTVKLAIQNAQTKKPDEDIQAFPQPHKPSNGKLSLDEKLCNLSVEEAASSFEQMLDTELPKNIYFLMAQGYIGSAETYLKNSEGINLYEKDAGYGFGTAYLSTHGFPNYEFHFEGSRKWGTIDSKSLAQIAIEKTLKGAKPKTLSLAGEYPIILPPSGSYGLMGGLFRILGQLLRGDKASRGETIFADRIGEAIASELFTLIDNPLHPDMITSTTYDAEGVPTQKTKLIDKGVLQTYYLDSYYAKKLNMESNGKAQRGGFLGGNPVKTPPAIGSYATIIESGDSSQEEMIAETKEGFMLQNFMGIHMSDLSSGRFSVTGAGWYIKNGEIKFPVQDITLSGTMPQLLLNIDMISKEREKGLMSEVPFLRVSKLEVAAKKMDFKVRLGFNIMKILIKLGIIKNPFI